MGMRSTNRSGHQVYTGRIDETADRDIRLERSHLCLFEHLDNGVRASCAMTNVKVNQSEGHLARVTPRSGVEKHDGVTSDGKNRFRPRRQVSYLAGKTTRL